MTKRWILGTGIAAVLVIAVSGYRPAAWQRYTLNGAAQGTTYHLVWYAQEAAADSTVLAAQFRKMDELFSRYQEGTAIDRFNKSARGILMDPLFKELILQSFAANRETGGISDITVLPLIRFWQQEASAGRKLTKKLRAVRACTGMQYLILKGDSLIKTKPCILIDLDGIAQGYTVDYLSKWLEARGVTNYMVEVGGELRTNGRHQPSGDPFRISVERPGADDWSVSENSLMVTPGNGALTTSGSYRKFIGTGTQKRNHIIDPRTGRPAESDLVSVTVYAENATIADAYDNALLAMGMKKALAFVNAHPSLAAYFIYRTPSGQLSDTASVRFITLKAAAAK